MSEKTYIGKSKIQGRGLIAGMDLSREDGFIGVTHEDNWPTSDMGQFYNHSDAPNARVSKIGNKHYIVPIDKIAANEEITVDYRKQKELEQPESFQNGGPINPIDLSNQSRTYDKVGLVPGTPEFQASPKFVQQGNKSFHFNPSNEINVMGTDRKAEPRYKRTLGDMMYDVFHPNKSPEVRMKFQNGGSIFSGDVSDTLGGIPKANISAIEWGKYKEDYAKNNPYSKMPDDAYITQSTYNDYLAGKPAHTWEAPVKQPPQIPVSTKAKPTITKPTPKPAESVTTPAPPPTPAPVVQAEPVEKKPAGQIVLPGSTTEWTQAYPGGPKYPKQRAASGATYNIKTGS